MVSFSKAKAVAPAEKKTKASKRDVVSIKGLETYAAIDAAIKALSSLKELHGQQIDQSVISHFVTVGAKRASRPENFTGTDNEATASCEMRKRSIRSPLSSFDLAILADHKIPVETHEVGVETFIINPAYAGDEALLGKVEKALNKVPGIPEDFIMQQNSVKTSVVSDETVKAVFATGDAKKIEILLPLVTSIALKPTMSDMKKVASIVSDMLKDSEDDNNN